MGSFVAAGIARCGRNDSREILMKLMSGMKFILMKFIFRTPHQA
jgi:hypothetical protein